MMRHRSITCAKVAIVCVALIGTSAIATDSPSAVPKVGPAVEVHLRSAQTAIKAKDWQAALTEIRKAEAIADKNALEAYRVDELLSVALANNKQYAEAAAVVDRTLESVYMPHDQRAGRMKIASQLHYRTKQYDKAVSWAQKYLEIRPDDDSTREMLAQSHYMLSDYNSAFNVASALISEFERRGSTPSETLLKLTMLSKLELGDPSEAATIRAKITRYYPNSSASTSGSLPGEIRWRELFGSLGSDREGKRALLFAYRLMEHRGELKTADLYLDMSQLALESGYPGDAHRVLSKALEENILKGEQLALARRIVDDAIEMGDKDREMLPKLVSSARTSPNGTNDVILGETFLSYGNIPAAIEAFRRGLLKGAVREPELAKLGLGVAYFRDGDRAKARASFESVTNGAAAIVAVHWLATAGNEAFPTGPASPKQLATKRTHTSPDTRWNSVLSFVGRLGMTYAEAYVASKTNATAPLTSANSGPPVSDSAAQHQQQLAEIRNSNACASAEATCRQNPNMCANARRLIADSRTSCPNLDRIAAEVQGSATRATYGSNRYFSCIAVGPIGGGLKNGQFKGRTIQNRCSESLTFHICDNTSGAESWPCSVPNKVDGLSWYDFQGGTEVGTPPFRNPIYATCRAGDYWNHHTQLCEVNPNANRSGYIAPGAN